MPDVLLTRHEAEGHLPDVCMCCGARATIRINRVFLASDPEVKGPSGFLEVFAIRLLIAIADAPRIRVRTSFCERHRHYWSLRSVILFGGLAGMLAVIVLGFLVVALLMTVGKVDAPWLSCCVIVPFLLYLVAWVIPARQVGSSSIRARLAEGGEVLLMNVGEAYVVAVRAARRPPRPPPLPDSYDYPGKSG